MSIEEIVAIIVGTVAVARATRLIVDEDMPIINWLVEKWIIHIPPRWNEIPECPWCTSVWMAMGSVTWAFLSDLHWTWWWLHLVLAGSYVAAMINVRDVPAQDREPPTPT